MGEELQTGGSTNRVGIFKFIIGHYFGGASSFVLSARVVNSKIMFDWM